jgi:hypothetical protein
MATLGTVGLEAWSSLLFDKDIFLRAQYPVFLDKGPIDIRSVVLHYPVQ